MVVTSVERAPGRQKLVGGVLKHVREPVLVLVNARREGRNLFCDWVFTHAGLVPGEYALTDGVTVVIPKALCGPEARYRNSTTLEVVA